MIASSLAPPPPPPPLPPPAPPPFPPPAGAGTGSLIVTLPGSPKAAKENLEALLKVLPHALELCGGARSRTTQVHQRLERGQDGLAGDGDAHPRRMLVPSMSPQRLQLGIQVRFTTVATRTTTNTRPDRVPSSRRIHQQQVSRSTPDRREGLFQLTDKGTALARSPVAARQRHSPWPMISVREAMDRIFEQAAPLKVQTMNVGPDLVGHVLADDVVSPRNVPSGPSTNIDGYAVRGERFPTSRSRG